ncbi:hypothetical protein ACFRAU_14925 [Arthrobacter sp. NPDC056691]|uniref:hypothetical protein n=1 Tax=Arthrobacter sp. NPDC056691 TaxID=3345913 RepID=UPI00366E23D5
MTGKQSDVRRRIAVRAGFALSFLTIFCLALYFLTPLEYPRTGGGATSPARGVVASAAGPGSLSVLDVAKENRRPGTPSDQVPTRWSSTTTLDGFLGQNASTPRRRTVDLDVDSTLGSINIQAFRIGYYNGADQRMVWASGVVRAQARWPTAMARAAPENGRLPVPCPSGGVQVQVPA